MDKKTKRHYYYNKKTLKSSWTRPACLKRHSSTGAASAGGKKTAWEKGGKFIERKDKKGRTYYIDLKTKKARWKLPPGGTSMTVGEYKAQKANLRKKGMSRCVVSNCFRFRYFDEWGGCPQKRQKREEQEENETNGELRSGRVNAVNLNPHTHRNTHARAHHTHSLTHSLTTQSPRHMHLLP